MLARLGTVCGQGVAQSVGLLRALTVSAVVSQVVADVREGIVRPGQLQHGQAGAGAHRFRERRWQRGGGGVLAVGGVELPVEGGLSPVSQVRDPGLLVGHGIDKLRGLGSFLGRKTGEKKKKVNISRPGWDFGCGVWLGAVAARWGCSAGNRAVTRRALEAASKSPQVPAWSLQPQHPAQGLQDRQHPAPAEPAQPTPRPDSPQSPTAPWKSGAVTVSEPPIASVINLHYLFNRPRHPACSLQTLLPA